MQLWIERYSVFDFLLKMERRVKTSLIQELDDWQSVEITLETIEKPTKMTTMKANNMIA